MDERTFKSEMGKARTMAWVEEDPGRVHYWRGYTRGLRRAYHGVDFGTEEQHQLYYNDAEDDLDEWRREVGRGYRDGLVAGGEQTVEDDLERLGG